ncbi:hypothetical protein CYY_009095 [Polysphondylium violaceum]|uniref:Uncharacterized protein n=1 Tax=Polysphondylium violaceum TaxID=133409 RepID=A0A8J4PNE0_9MYCE|nr:hypothetical protein CYY_009095 [Polysphondylium violaceum]
MQSRDYPISPTKWDEKHLRRSRRKQEHPCNQRDLIWWYLFKASRERRFPSPQCGHLDESAAHTFYECPWLATNILPIVNPILTLTTNTPITWSPTIFKLL